MYALVYTVYRCGFYPRCAMEEDNALNNRLNKIERIITECKYGIHDISRTELNNNGLPRFNMPFELGLFFGAKKFGTKNQKSKSALILEKSKYSYQEFLSDINGIDTKAHNDDINTIIKLVRTWLFNQDKTKVIVGERKIANEFNTFITYLPKTAIHFHIDSHELSFNSVCILVEEFIKEIS